MSLRRVRAAAPYKTRRDPVQRDRSWGFGFGVDAREVLEVLVLRPGSTSGSVDGFALGNGGFGLSGCGGTVVL
jgi:hypothetical protein